MERKDTMTKLQILGTGCPKCRKLTEFAEQAARELGIEYELTKVTDINDIIAFGVMSTPALVVDGKVALAGRTATPEEIKKLLVTQEAK
jgi:small redox-active disulfide protein 2